MFFFKFTIRTALSKHKFLPIAISIRIAGIANATEKQLEPKHWTFSIRQTMKHNQNSCRPHHVHITMTQSDINAHEKHMFLKCIF